MQDLVLHCINAKAPDLSFRMGYVSVFFFQFSIHVAAPSDRRLTNGTHTHTMAYSVEQMYLVQTNLISYFVRIDFILRDVSCVRGLVNMFDNIVRFQFFFVLFYNNINVAHQ